MPWTPLFNNYAGMLPVLTAAKAIIERDQTDALAWSFGADPAGPDFARIQTLQRFSRNYPLLIIQPARWSPDTLGAGGINQNHVFRVSIYCTKQLASGDPNDALEALTADLLRYFDAVCMAWWSAPSDDWYADFPGGVSDAGQGKVKIEFANGVFGNIETAVATNGLYLLSMYFELQVSLTESES